MEKQKKIKRCASDRVLITIFYILVAIFAIVCLYPLLLAIGTSFADEASVTVNGYRVIPKKFSLSAYQMIPDPWVKPVECLYGDHWRYSIRYTSLGSYICGFCLCADRERVQSLRAH